MLPIICLIAGVILGAAAALCLVAVMRGIDCDEDQETLEDA